LSEAEVDDLPRSKVDAFSFEAEVPIFVLSVDSLARGGLGRWFHEKLKVEGRPVSLFVFPVMLVESLSWVVE
jgi:hypothetical protein